MKARQVVFWWFSSIHPLVEGYGSGQVVEVSNSAARVARCWVVDGLRGEEQIVLLWCYSYGCSCCLKFDEGWRARGLLMLVSCELTRGYGIFDDVETWSGSSMTGAVADSRCWPSMGGKWDEAERVTS